MARSRGLAVVGRGLLTIAEIPNCRTTVLLDVTTVSRGLWMASARLMLSHGRDLWVSWSGGLFIDKTVEQSPIIGYGTIFTFLDLAFP